MGKKHKTRAAAPTLLQANPQAASAPTAAVELNEVKAGYPIWNTRSVMALAIPVLVFITVLVYAISNRSFIVETERVLLAISACLFLFFAFGLYSGVQIQKPGKDLDIAQDGFQPSAPARQPNWLDVFTAMLYITPPDLSKVELPKIDLDGVSGSGDDLVGCLVSIVLWIVAAIVITVLVWVLAQVLAIVLPLLGVALYWLFYRALKFVFAKSSECCKQIGPTLKYSLLYTVLFTGWLFVVLELSKRWLG